MDNEKVLTKRIACGIVNSVFRDWVYIGIQTCKAKSALQVFLFTPHLLHGISGLPYSEYVDSWVQKNLKKMIQRPGSREGPSAAGRHHTIALGMMLRS